MRPDYDDMRDFQYREENPGYEREIGLTAADLDDCDPETARLVAESYAHDNGRRRAHNARTREMELEQRNQQLCELLRHHGIDVPDYGN